MKNLELLKTEVEKNPIKHLIVPPNVDDISYFTQDSFLNGSQQEFKKLILQGLGLCKSQRNCVATRKRMLLLHPLAYCLIPSWDAIYAMCWSHISALHHDL